MEKRKNYSFIIGLIIVIGMVLYLVIQQYQYSVISEDKLSEVTENYSSYRNSKNNYFINCESGKSYCVSKALLSSEEMDALSSGDELNIQFAGKRDIIVLKVNGEYLLTLEETHDGYHHQMIRYIIVFSCLIALGIGMRFMLNIFINKKSNKEQAKLNNKDEDKKEVLDEDLYQEIKNAIYEKDGVYRFKNSEAFDLDENDYTLYKAMMDYLKEDQFLLAIDDMEENDEVAHIFYKLNNKLQYDMLFREGKVPFEINPDFLDWYYPEYSEILEEEKASYKHAIDEYVFYNPELLKIRKEDNKKRKLFF